MSKFDDICKAVSVLKADSDTYWNKLYKVFGQFNRELMAYWGISGGVVMDNAGTQHPVFATGVYNPDEKDMIPRAGFMLPKEGKKLCFDLLLNLPDAESDRIVIRNNIRIKFQYVDGVYFFEADGCQSAIECDEVDGEVDFTPFFDALHSQLMNSLKFKK